MIDKNSRKEFYIAMIKKDFEKLKKYLDSDDNPVYLTFLSENNYTNHKKNNSVMLKIAFEKA